MKNGTGLPRNLSMLSDLSSLSSLTGFGSFWEVFVSVFWGSSCWCVGGVHGGGGSEWLTCGWICVVLPMVGGWWWRELSWLGRLVHWGELFLATVSVADDKFGGVGFQDGVFDEVFECFFVGGEESEELFVFFLIKEVVPGVHVVDWCEFLGDGSVFDWLFHHPCSPRAVWLPGEERPDWRGGFVILD